MTAAEFDAYIESALLQCKGILSMKGPEYAGPDDRLANFKRAAAHTGAPPLLIAFVYATKHWDAVANYVRATSNGKPLRLSEPIEGRLQDLINYLLFIGALIKEENGGAKNPPM
jgi:hypothetical protein